MTAASHRILLVEDHPVTVRLFARILRMLGYEVTTAAGVAEALALASSQPFDFLISDIGLPDGSGLQIMRDLHDRLGLRGIAISGFGRAEDFQRSQDAGFLEHLVKPISFETLEHAVSRWASWP